MILAKIRNFSYDKQLREKLPICEYSDVNDLASKCCITINEKTFGFSKWVSPKRTRSYPYSRVYDTFDECNSKTVTIIPIIKDEGADGDMDYLQWDTISFMSLLGIYVIIGFYDAAELNTRNSRKPNKITNQKLNNAYISDQLLHLSRYHHDALHWNLNQLEQNNLIRLTNLARHAYENIGRNLNIRMHPPKNIDRFLARISKDRESYMSYSREKAKKAQNREVLTLQPKEAIGVGEKMPITIENYLGGYYFFTVDDVIVHNDIIYLIESKHTNYGLLPAIDDIKDGLLKLMLYNNLDEIVDLNGVQNHRVVLRLTSTELRANISLPNDLNEINKFLFENSLENKRDLILQLHNEAVRNNFTIWIEQV